MEKSVLQNWVSDNLISFFGYSSPLMVQYFLALSKEATSPENITQELLNYGLPRSEEILAFSDEVFNRVERRITGLSLYQREEKEKMIFARKQRNYRVIEVEEDEVEDLGEIDDGLEKDVKLDHGFEKISKLDDRNEKNRESDNGFEGIGKSDDGYEKSGRIDEARKISRADYTKRREKRKIEELRDEIEDEYRLFGKKRLTEKEKRDLKYKEELYEIVKKRIEDDVEDARGYVIPEAYDGEGRVDQERRFAVANVKYGDERHEGKRNARSEQTAWEDAQLKKANLRFGSRNRKLVIYVKLKRILMIG